MPADRETTPTDIIGADAVAKLREAGFAVVPFDVPHYAVGEVMTWTGCSCPNVAWEAINCAINYMAVEGPWNLDDLAQLGAGEITLAEWRRQREAKRVKHS